MMMTVYFQKKKKNTVKNLETFPPHKEKYRKKTHLKHPNVSLQNLKFMALRGPNAYDFTAVLASLSLPNGTGQCAGVLGLQNRMFSRKSHVI